jgi:16S rRNA (adenine1518-N6/adenine1519-N6)-dimethyltransferase
MAGKKEPEAITMNDHPKLTSPSQVRAWIEARQFLPSKVLGQNFLIDENILRIMIDSTEVAPDDGVLEVGPGLGILTEPLAEKAARVVAVEKDKRLAAHLAEVFKEQSKLTLINNDALDINLGELKKEHQLNRFVSNLPYSVGSRILVECFKLLDGFERLVVTVQLEVAERLAARSDTSDYGLLSVWAQMDYEVKIAKRIAHSCFYPRPQVTSAIVVLKKNHARRQALPDPARFDALIKHAFSQRRKQLGTSLSSFRYSGLTSSPAEAAVRADLDPKRRPETLTVDDWIKLDASI